MLADGGRISIERARRKSMAAPCCLHFSPRLPNRLKKCKANATRMLYGPSWQTCGQTPHDQRNRAGVGSQSHTRTSALAQCSYWNGMQVQKPPDSLQSDSQATNIRRKTRRSAEARNPASEPRPNSTGWSQARVLNRRGRTRQNGSAATAVRTAPVLRRRWPGNPECDQPIENGR